MQKILVARIGSILKSMSHFVSDLNYYINVTDPWSKKAREEGEQKGKGSMRRWPERARAGSEEVRRNASRWEGSKD